jgi:NTP pyrophosphatase (non-canonical NTP hydrolase)
MHNLINVLEYIKALSISDKKTLIGKTLKAAEELGELSREVLPYEGEYATTHRFPNKDKVLEESVDLMLCALSVPFSMGYTIEDITEVMKTKSDKWAGLQQASDRGTFPLPFEIHVTVRTGRHQEFINKCKLIDVKPIVLDLQAGASSSIDVMTSSVIISDNIGAYDEMKRIGNELREYGFEVVREKIETVPWHPAAPSMKYNTAGNGGYFECHFNVIIRNDKDKADVEAISKLFDCHLSKNKFKVTVDYYNQMMTLRKYNTTREEFDSLVNRVEYELADSDKDLDLEKIVMEYAIYDTNVSHDTSWIKGE